MTAQEIRDAQEQLRSTLSPDLLKFIQNRRPAPGNTVAKSAQTKTLAAPSVSEAVTRTEADSDSAEQPEANKTCDNVAASKAPELAPATRASPPLPDLLNKYPNMNRDEPEKREWMGEVPEAEVGGRLAATGFVARFGFDGRLLDPSAKVVISKTVKKKISSAIDAVLPSYIVLLESNLKCKVAVIKN